MSYAEALRYLARKYNIEIIEKEQTDEEKQKQNEREAMYALNEFALKHFRHNLQETPEGRSTALPYFRHRGLSDAMIERFRLGYALELPGEFINAAKEAGFSEKYLIDTGLAGVSQREGQENKLYDRYRGRVIFPILSISGRTVGFGARTMKSDKSIAKYVNSPESIIYHKNQELYGFYQAKSAIAKADKCIMVEGYLDVISMHQAGVEYVVASSGTSLTEGQIRAVGRFTDNVTLIYDADAAGIKASLRGIRMLLAEKMNVKVLSLPQGDDPDSFAQSHSSEEVEAYLREHETDIIAFMTSVLMKDINTSDPTARAKIINVILETIAYVDEPVKRQEYLSECSRAFNIEEDVLLRQLNIFITRRKEEEYKQRQREKALANAREYSNDQNAEQQNPSEETANNQPEVDTSTTEPASAPLLDLSDRHLRPFEEMLTRYLVRYGMCYIADIAQDDGTSLQATVYDIIASELALDGIHFTEPDFLAIFNAVGDIRQSSFAADRAEAEKIIAKTVEQRLETARTELASQGASMNALVAAEQRLQSEAATQRIEMMAEFESAYVRQRLINSSDDAIRQTANELASERYVLSNIYRRQGAESETEQSQLRTLVPRAINELRAAILNDILSDLNKRLAQTAPNDTAGINDIIQKMQAYKDYQQQLGKALGERIILPKR